MNDLLWSVTLTDFETACDLAAERGHTGDEDDVNELFYVEDEEVEFVTHYATRDEAEAFARSSYSSNPPNWPTVRGPKTFGIFDGVSITWERTR